MPRNTAGTMTLPAGQPVTSGTVINSATHNALMSDIATALTDSLSRSGAGGMLAPLRTPNGSLSAPTHSFTDDPDTGLMSLGANNPGLVVGGSLRQEWNATGTVVNGKTTTTTLEVGGAEIVAAATAAANGGVRLGAVPGSVANPVVPVVNATDDVDAGTRKVVNVEDPTNAQDAATKAYVDGRGSGARVFGYVLTSGAGAATVYGGAAGPITGVTASWSTTDLTVTFPSIGTVSSAFPVLVSMADGASSTYFVPWVQARSATSITIRVKNTAGTDQNWNTGLGVSFAIFKL